MLKKKLKNAKINYSFDAQYLWYSLMKKIKAFLETITSETSKIKSNFMSMSTNWHEKHHNKKRSCYFVKYKAVI